MAALVDDALVAPARAGRSLEGSGFAAAAAVSFVVALLLLPASLLRAIRESPWSRRN